MEALQLLGQGFATCFTPLNLSFIFIGVLIGQIIGALPGIGPAAGMALLLPLTYGVPPVTASSHLLTRSSVAATPSRSSLGNAIRSISFARCVFRSPMSAASFSGFFQV